MREKVDRIVSAGYDKNNNHELSTCLFRGYQRKLNSLERGKL